MAGRKVRNEKEAVACLQAQQQSGLSLTTWAQTHGFDGRSINAWKMTLARRESEPMPIKPIRVVELVPGVPQRAATQLEVHCGPFTIVVPQHFEDEALERLLGVG